MKSNYPLCKFSPNMVIKWPSFGHRIFQLNVVVQNIDCTHVHKILRPVLSRMGRVKHLRIVISLVFLFTFCRLALADEEAVVETYSEAEAETVDTDISKAYEGKGAKVLPILAKLQKKYESMDDQDKNKLLEKADSYRKRFKTAIDKIDEGTAVKYGLNINLIHKILGLDAVKEEDSHSKEAEETEVETSKLSIEPVTKTEAEVKYEDEDAPVYDPPLEIKPRTNEQETFEENYDHLITFLDQEEHTPSTLDVDDLKDEPVYIPGEDEHYQELADSLKMLAADILRMDRQYSHDDGPRPIYPTDEDDMDEDDYRSMLEQIPFPQYAPSPRIDTMDPYDAEYFYDPREAAYAIQQGRPQGHLPLQPPLQAYLPNRHQLPLYSYQQILPQVYYEPRVQPTLYPVFSGASRARYLPRTLSRTLSRAQYLPLAQGLRNVDDLYYVRPIVY